MPKTIRIIDIANELGLSRNTVAKALNGKAIPEKTRRIVFEKSVEMGYKSMGFVTQERGTLRNQRILILTSHPLSNLNFFMSIIKGVENYVRNMNFEILQYTFNLNTTYRELSNYIRSLELDGIICIESFEEKFVKHLLSLQMPTVFIDFAQTSKRFDGIFDVVMMENIKSVQSLCFSLIDQQKKTSFGFVGDYRHCLGFYERYLGMREALFESDISYDSKHSITKPDSFPYGNFDEMKQIIKSMSNLPQVFVCANDSIAVNLVKTLQAMKYRIPEDIAVIGFDDTIESRVLTPRLTTIQIDKEHLGKQAIQTLIQRIKHPKEKIKTIYIETKPILRDSTPPVVIG